MTATLSAPTIADRKRYIREKLKAENHQPVPEKLISFFISSINKESDVLLVDAGCVIALSLIEQGHNPDKIFVAEDSEGEYKSVADKMSEIYGFHHIQINVDKISTIMKFDYILGNPPFQAEKRGGRFRGSASNATYLNIVINSLKLLKPGGELKFITPILLFSGGDIYRNLFVGAASKYDVVSVNFDTNDYFPKVGIKMCHWHIKNTCTSNFLTTIDSVRQVNLKQSHFLTSNEKFDKIIHILAGKSGNKFNFNTANRYDYSAVKRYIDKNNLGLPEKLQETPDEVFKYPVNRNGKICYGAVEWKDVGVWRIFIPFTPPQLKALVQISNEWSAHSTLTMRFDSETECKKVYELLNTPEYLWIITQTIKSGRVDPTIINLLPIAPVNELLSDEQLNYIQSQL